jgi:2-dehydro-3-deoxy-D-gluconate 5-dehydrogenase
VSADPGGLQGRVILVTGASRGLGASIARGLADCGASVVAAARSLDALAVVVAHRPDLMSAERADLRDLDCLGDLVDGVVARHGHLDVLINNAGIAPAGRYADQDPHIWRETLDINVLAPMVLSQAAGRHFIAQKSGKIINVASTTGVRGKPLLVAYSASKGALVRMTEALAAEWARHGVQVNAVAPGAFATDAQSAVLESPELLQRRIRKIPAGRIADPGEIVPLVCLLASPGSDYITGSVFVIDGGEAGKL